MKREDNKWTCTWISAQVSSATHVKTKNKSRKFWIPFMLHDAKEIILSYLILCNVDRFSYVYVVNITYATWPKEQNYCPNLTELKTKPFATHLYGCLRYIKFPYCEQFNHLRFCLDDCLFLFWTSHFYFLGASLYLSFYSPNSTPQFLIHLWIGVGGDIYFHSDFVSSGRF